MWQAMLNKVGLDPYSVAYTNGFVPNVIFSHYGVLDAVRKMLFF